MTEYIATWTDPDGIRRRSMPRSHLRAMSLAANLLAAKLDEVVASEDGTLRRETTRKTKTNPLVTNVRIEQCLP